MATKLTAACADSGPKTKIPFFQYLSFRRAKNREKVELLNERVTRGELRKEARIVRKLRRKGKLREGNGLEMFVQACKRRLGKPDWHRVEDHSERVRRYSYCIAKALDHTDVAFARVVGLVAGNHDIGKTLIAQYLVNREDGTWFGIGKADEDGNGRIDYEKELWVLRHSHLEAGLRFLRLYAEFMKKEEYDIAKWIIGGHHIAFDGIGSAGAPCYPSRIGEVSTRRYLKTHELSVAARIVRTADVYSAIIEDRFYKKKEERIGEKAKGMKKDDAALGVLITVAGVDVDPEMVKYLIIGKHNTKPDVARDVVANLACREPKWLQKRDGDWDFSIEWVIPKERFQNVIKQRDSYWDQPVNTDVIILGATA